MSILLDANVVIDLHRWNLWDAFAHAHSLAVTPIIQQETRFYRDQRGRKQSINIEASKVELIDTSLKDYSVLGKLLSTQFLFGIDDGEREAIGYLYNQKGGHTRFCTADRLAIKCLGVLGLRHCAVSLESLLPSKKVLPSYSQNALEKGLVEGFQEAHLYLVGSA